MDPEKEISDYEKFHNVFYDRDGCPLDVYTYKGFPIHYIRELFKCFLRSTSVKVRPDDILLYSFPNAGSHWTFEIVNMILNQKAERTSCHKESLLLEIASMEEFEAAESPRLINTHLPPEYIPPDLLQDHKIIFLVRNPKAIAVSYYRHIMGFEEFNYEGNYPSFFEMFMDGKIPYGDLFKHTQTFWSLIKDKPNVLILTYEELSWNPLEVISRISQFLGKTTSSQLAKNIVEICSFDKMKVEKRTQDSNLPQGIIKSDFTIFHSGKVDTWKSWLTVEQSERLDAKIQSEFIDQGISFNF